MSRIQIVLIVAIVALGGLFLYAAWRSGDSNERTKALINEIHSNIHQGSTREEIETYLRRRGATTSFEPAANENGPAVMHAMLFNVRQVGKKHQNLKMEFWFDPTDHIRYYTIDPELVDENARPTPVFQSVPSATPVEGEPGSSTAMPASESGSSGAAAEPTPDVSPETSPTPAAEPTPES